MIFYKHKNHFLFKTLDLQFAIRYNFPIFNEGEKYAKKVR